MRTILILALACSTFLISTCSNEPRNGSDGKASVVASLYPLAFIAERIGGECVRVTNLTPPGIEPHDMELTPDAVESIATADAVLYLGGGFQPTIEGAVGDASGEVVDLLGVVSTTPAEGAEAAEGLIVDPHVWLDPGRFAVIATATADVIERTGAAASCDVAGSAASLRAELERLDDDFRTGLGTCERDLIVTNHAAFGYLASAYGLTQEAIAGLEPETEPSAKRMAELKDLVEREGVTTILTEELVAPDVAETLAAEAGVDTAVLYTIEGLTDEEAAAGENYVSLMGRNLETLRAALACR
jgi:zinc transport system substrate-binding protein